MNIVLREPRVRWLPGRYSFAVFRLYALLRLLRAERGSASMILPIDHGQSAMENYAVSVWTVLTVAAYFVGVTARTISLPLAIVLALPAAGAALQIPLYVVGAMMLPFRRNNQTVISRATFIALFVTAIAAIRTTTWLRYVGASFIAVVVLNAVAAIAMFVLAPVVKRLEAECAN